MSSIAMDGRWARTLWIGILAGLSAGLTGTYTCIVPFAGLGVAAAMTLPRREALVCAAAVWLANQTAGFGMLSYPWTLDALGWGLAIGAGAMVATVSAQWLVQRLPRLRPAVRAAIAFAAAFAVYELTLLAAAVAVLGGAGAFAPGIVAQVLIVNAVSLVGLYGLSHVFALALSRYRRRVSAAPAPVA
jgi:hypothetical protein